MKHISKVGDVFYYRLRLPMDMAVHFKGRHSRELKRSLKTRSLRSAKHMTKIYDAEAEKLFTRIRSNVMTNEEIKRLVGKCHNIVHKKMCQYIVHKSSLTIE